MKYRVWLAVCTLSTRARDRRGAGGWRREDRTGHGASVAARDVRMGATACGCSARNTNAARKCRSHVPAFQCWSAHAYYSAYGDRQRERDNGERVKEMKCRSRCLYANREFTNGAAAPSISRSFQKVRSAFAPVEQERTTVRRKSAGKARFVVRVSCGRASIITTGRHPQTHVS